MKKITLLKTICFLFLFSLVLWNCDSEVEIPKTKESMVLETMSKRRAKSLITSYLEEKKKKFSLDSKKNNKFSFKPIWESLSQEKLSFTEALLTHVKINSESTLLEDTRLFFIKKNGFPLQAIETKIDIELDTKGNLIKGKLFYHNLEGKFLIGYQIKSGRVYELTLKKQEQKASFLAIFLFQSGCNGELNADDLATIDDGCLDAVDLGTVGGKNPLEDFMKRYRRKDGSIEGSGTGGGEISAGGGSGGGAGAQDPNKDPLTGKCKAGYVKDLFGKCVKPEHACVKGKVYNFITKKCECPKGQIADINGNCVKKCETTKEDLKKVFPSTPDNKLKEIANAINSYAKNFGIDTKEKLRHFLAQAGHESAKMKVFEENLNYRWKKLGIDYWKNYFNPHTDGDKDKNKEDPNDYKRSSTSSYVKKEKFANHVYYDENRGKGYKLGNTSETDGYKYRGRGIIQLTGKSNYEKFNIFYKNNYDKNKDLISNPDLLKTDMKIAVISALWFFKNNVLNKLTINDKTTVKAVTKKVNGGINGLSDRKELYNKAKINIDCK